MKKKVLVLLTLFAMLTSFFTMVPVSADEGSNVINYPELTISKAQWYTSIENNFGGYYLHIAGHVNASVDKITIDQHGDGSLGEALIKVDEGGNFDGTFQIGFTHAPGEMPFTSATRINVYTDKGKVSYTLESGELKYDIKLGPNKICGYISPNCVFNKDRARDLLSGYKIELVGTGRNATTDISGYFVINNLADGTYTLKITRSNCLSKIIPNVVVKGGDVCISEQSKPTETYIGDINKDNAINLVDVMMIAKVFNCKDGDGRYYTYYDLNVDSVVNMQDIMILANNFNRVGE